MAYTFNPYQKKEYQESDAVKQAQVALQTQQAAKPGAYQSPYEQQLDKILGDYQSRGKFQYDMNADAMYQQLLDRYVGQGQMAMMDTMGQAAALTGGYGNSNAQMVGQQAYQNYLQGAYDMMPQFYDMALQRYMAEGDQMLQEYGMLSDRENQAYSRYQDDVNRYFADLDRAQSAYDTERNLDYSRFADEQDFDYRAWQTEQEMGYRQDRDAVADSQWQQQFDYNQAMADREYLYQLSRDEINDQRYADETDYSHSIDERNWQYQLDRDALEDQRYDTQWDYGVSQDAQQLAQAQVNAMLEKGADIPDELLAASGYDPAYISALKKKKSSGSSGTAKTKTPAELAADALSQGMPPQAIVQTLVKTGLSLEDAQKALSNSQKYR